MFNLKMGNLLSVEPESDTLFGSIISTDSDDSFEQNDIEQIESYSDEDQINSFFLSDECSFSLKLISNHLNYPNFDIQQEYKLYLESKDSKIMQFRSDVCNYCKMKLPEEAYEIFTTRFVDFIDWGDSKYLNIEKLIEYLQATPYDKFRKVVDIAHSFRGEPLIVDNKHIYTLYLQNRVLTELEKHLLYMDLSTGNIGYGPKPQKELCYIDDISTKYNYIIDYIENKELDDKHLYDIFKILRGRSGQFTLGENPDILRVIASGNYSDNVYEDILYLIEILSVREGLKRNLVMIVARLNMLDEYERIQILRLLYQKCPQHFNLIFQIQPIMFEKMIDIETISKISIHKMFNNISLNGVLGTPHILYSSFCQINNDIDVTNYLFRHNIIDEICPKKKEEYIDIDTVDFISNTYADYNAGLVGYQDFQKLISLRVPHLAK